MSFLNDDARAVALHYIRGKWGLISPTILSSSLFTPVRYDYPPLFFVCCEILCKQGFDIRLEGDKFSLAKGDGACKKA